MILNEKGGGYHPCAKDFQNWDFLQKTTRKRGLQVVPDLTKENGENTQRHTESAVESESECFTMERDGLSQHVVEVGSTAEALIQPSGRHPSLARVKPSGANVSVVQT